MQAAQPLADARPGTRRARGARSSRTRRSSASASARTSAISRCFSSGGGELALDRFRQRLHRGRQPAQLLLAALAVGEVPLEVGDLIAVEGADRVGGDFLEATVVLVLVHASPSASSPRIFSKPNRIRPFTVPSGTFSMPAISDWLKPPK